MGALSGSTRSERALIQARRGARLPRAPRDFLQYKTSFNTRLAFSTRLPSVQDSPSVNVPIAQGVAAIDRTKMEGIGLRVIEARIITIGIAQLRFARMAGDRWRGSRGLNESRSADEGSQAQSDDRLHDASPCYDHIVREVVVFEAADLAGLDRRSGAFISADCTSDSHDRVTSEKLPLRSRATGVFLGVSRRVRFRTAAPRPKAHVIKAHVMVAAGARARSTCVKGPLPNQPRGGYSPCCQRLQWQSLPRRCSHPRSPPLLWPSVHPGRRRKAVRTKATHCPSGIAPTGGDIVFAAPFAREGISLSSRFYEMSSSHWTSSS
jgi:hypothetical protein